MPSLPPPPSAAAARCRASRASTGASTAPSRRRPRIGFIGLLAGCLAGCAPEPPPRPDLFLITVDALAADRLGCFGGPYDAAPTVCALARGGMLFSWAATEGWGEASGAASVVTGRAVGDHGVRDGGARFLPERLPTIAERLTEAGFATAAFVASPRLNRSRRLDQGFSLYDDRLDGDPSTIARRVDEWLASRPSPRFVWIHARRDAGVVALDRLVAHLEHRLDPDDGTSPGIVFAALRGEAPGSSGPEADRLGTTPRGDHVGEALSWRRHRVPMLWRPPGAGGAGRPRVVSELVSIADVAATLARAAGLPPERPIPGVPVSIGLPLGSPASTEDGSPPRRLLLSSGPQPERRAHAGYEVGLATNAGLYARRPSLLDGSGQPVPTNELAGLRARYVPIPRPDPIRDPTPRSAARTPRAWRTDVLDPDSPIAPLEFHLARKLRARARAEAPEEESP